MVPLFSFTMDTLYADLSIHTDLGVTFEHLTIPGLEYMDDVATFAVGRRQQEKTLNVLNVFAIKRKLEWGVQKCKVMEIGGGKRKEKWRLGAKTIESCRTYKYLGEEISIDGKNSEILTDRMKKVKSAVMATMTCGRSAVMRKIETSILLKLHETVTLPTLLFNAETWDINNSDRKEIDRMELWALKQMFGLPITTPTPAIIFATGTMYASVRVDIKRLNYLHKLLQKENENWARMTLNLMDKNNVGWAKSIKTTLQSWGLEEQWNIIAQKTQGEWKREVEEAAEKINKERLKTDCLVMERGNLRAKTKSKTILKEIERPDFKRKPLDIMNYGSAVVTRALIMGRYGMLKCKSNFSCGNGRKLCDVCGSIDDEDHRINYCVVYQSINRCNSESKIDFNCIYSDDLNESLKVVKIVLGLWDLGNGRNEMRDS